MGKRSRHFQKPSRTRDRELSELRALLRRYGIYPKKRLGQTFLYKQYIAEEIVYLANITPNDVIVEIGPGTGVLTYPLARTGVPVIGLEYDTTLVSLLHQTLTLPGVTILRADALTFDYANLSKHYGKKLSVIGNLPYYLTSPLVFKLLSLRHLFKSIMVMMQKEVADRIVAQPGTRTYGTISIFSQLYCKVSKLLTVTKDYFYPQPQVDSEILLFSIRDEPLVTLTNEKVFERLVRASFSQRRKTLANALKGANYLDMGRERIIRSLENSGIDPSRRPETLSIEEFSRLCKWITKC